VIGVDSSQRLALPNREFLPKEAIRESEDDNDCLTNRRECFNDNDDLGIDRDDLQLDRIGGIFSSRAVGHQFRLGSG
jgi:hypothetical protein